MNYNWIAHPLYWSNTQICIKSKIWSKVISKNRSVKSTIKYLRKAQFKKTSVLTSNISRKWRKQKLTCVYDSVHHLYFMCTCTCITSKNSADLFYRPITQISQWVLGHMEFVTKSKILILKPTRALQSEWFLPSKHLPVQS